MTCEYCGRTNLGKSECCNGCGAPLKFDKALDAISPQPTSYMSEEMQRMFPYQYALSRSANEDDMKYREKYWRF